MYNLLLLFFFVGSCYNSPLVINIRKLSMNFQGLVSYEIGKTYYFAGNKTIAIEQDIDACMCLIDNM